MPSAAFSSHISSTVLKSIKGFTQVDHFDKSSVLRGISTDRVVGLLVCQSVNISLLIFFLLLFPFSLVTAPGQFRRWRLLTSSAPPGHGIASSPMWFLWVRRPSSVCCRVCTPGRCGLWFRHFVHIDIVERPPSFIQEHCCWNGCGPTVVKKLPPILIE